MEFATQINGNISNKVRRNLFMQGVQLYYKGKRPERMICVLAGAGKSIKTVVYLN